MNEREIEFFVRSWTMLPRTGGVFEVTVNGELVFSKKALKRHAQPGEIHTAILKKLESIRPSGITVPESDDH